MKSLITGVDGFVGSHLAEYLLGRGDDVAGTYHFDPAMSLLGEAKDSIDAYRLDLREAPCIKTVLEQTKPDRIYHLAAMAFVPASFKDPALTFEVNLRGTMALYESISQLGIEPQILYVSTAEIFGIVSHDELPLTETSPTRPNSPYSISKLAAEQMSRYYAARRGLRIVSVRPFNHTGPRQSPHFVCSDFARQIAEIEKGHKEPKMSVGNLEARRDFSDVRDIVAAYGLALDKCPLDGDIYIVGSGGSVSIQSALDSLLSMTDAKISVEQDPARLRPSDLPDIYGDCAKFRQATGWRPQHDIDATLRSVLDYWRENV